MMWFIIISNQLQLLLKIRIETSISLIKHSIRYYNIVITRSHPIVLKFPGLMLYEFQHVIG